MDGQFVEDAEIAVHPRLVFVVVEGTVGKNTQPLPAAKGCGDAFIVPGFVRPAKEFEDLLAAEVHFGSNCEIFETRGLGYGPW